LGEVVIYVHVWKSHQLIDIIIKWS